MSSFLTRWMEPSIGNQAALRAVVRKLIASGFKQESLAADIGMKAPNFSAWKNGRIELPDAKYLQLVLVGYHNGWLADPFYERANQFLGRPHHRVFDTKVSYYKVYRYSYLAPGMIFRGSLTVTRDAERNVATTSEHYRIPKEIRTRDGTQMERNFERRGYYFIRAGHYRLLISNKIREPHEIQIAYLIAHDMGEALLTGSLSDWHAGSLYCTALVAKYQPEPLPNDQITTISFEDVEREEPDLVRYLTRRPPLEANVVVLERDSHDQTEPLRAKSDQTNPDKR